MADQPFPAMDFYQSYAGFNHPAPRFLEGLSDQQPIYNGIPMYTSPEVHGHGHVAGYQDEAYAPRDAFSMPHQSFHPAYNGTTAPDVIMQRVEDKMREDFPSLYFVDHSYVGYGRAEEHIPAVGDAARNHQRDLSQLRYVELIQDEAILRYKLRERDSSDKQYLKNRLSATNHWVEQNRELASQETTEWAAKIIAARKTYEAARSFEDDDEFLGCNYDGEIGFHQTTVTKSSSLVLSKRPLTSDLKNHCSRLQRG